MGATAIFLLIAWVIGLMTGTTFGGTLHVFPFAAAVLGVLYFLKRRRDNVPKKPEKLKRLKGRTTWTV